MNRKTHSLSSTYRGPDTYDEFLTVAEGLLPGSIASLYLVNSDGSVLVHYSAPKLPVGYACTLNRIVVGPASGSSGTSAYRRQIVVADNIENDPLWEPDRALALEYGLRACWAFPLFGRSGRIIAVLEFYFSEVRTPQIGELDRVTDAAKFLALVIEQDRKDTAISPIEQRFRSTFPGVGEGIAITSLDGRFLEVNSAYCSLVGFTSDELLVMNVQELTYEGDWQSTKVLFEEMESGDRESTVTENRYVTKTGDLKWARITASLLRDSEGQSQRFMRVAEAIHLRSAETEQLHMLQTAISHLNDMLVITEADINDSGPRIIFVNEAFERRTGYSLKEVVGKTPRLLQGPNTQRKELDRIRASLEKWQPVRAELINYTKDGEEFWVELDIVPVADSTGWVTHWVAIERDVTERKEVQQEIQRLNTDLENRVQRRTVALEAAVKELEAFSYSVSHDLRSPLYTVNSFCTLLQKSSKDKLDEKSKHYLDRMRVGIQQMATLIDGLLSLAKISREPLKITTVDLQLFVQKFENECRERDSGREVQVDIEEGLQAVGDATMLLVVMQNLFENAWKYTGKQASAKISIGSRLGELGEKIYFVTDNGAGFNMAYEDKLFGAFQRLHAPTEFSGTGIGLANVKRVIDRHGGRIWAESEVNKGAAFYFTLAPTQNLI